MIFFESKELVLSHLLNMYRYNIVIGNEEDVLLFYGEKLSIKWALEKAKENKTSLYLSSIHTSTTVSII